MPTLVWRYPTALLYYGPSTSCVALADALQTLSYDRWTRMLRADWSGQTLLELAVRTLFVWERGYLILDDTLIPKRLRPPWRVSPGYTPARSASPSMASR